MEIDETYRNDMAVERVVLGGLVGCGADAFAEYDGLLSEEDFTEDTNRVIYRVLREMFVEKGLVRYDHPTFLAVAAGLGVRDVFDDKRDLRYLRTVENFGPHRENLDSSVAQLKRRTVRRQALGAVEGLRQRLEGAGEESVHEIVSLVENEVISFSEKVYRPDHEDGEDLADVGRAWLQRQATDPVDSRGLSTGFPTFDEVTGGLRPGHVTTIGARSGVGKSNLGIHIGLHVAKQGIPVLYLDNEMAFEDHLPRVYACLSGVHVDAIDTGKFALDEFQSDAVNDAAEQAEGLRFKFKSVVGQKPEEILSFVRRWVRQHVGLREDGQAEPCLVVFDYVKLTSGDALSKHLQEYQALGFLMTQLHQLAVKCSVPILTFCQLNREGIRGEDASVVSGSDRIYHLSSTFAIFKPQSREELDAQAGNEKRYSHKFVVLKTRKGRGLPPGNYINVDADLGRLQITEGPTQRAAEDADPKRPFRNSVGKTRFSEN